MSLSEKFVNEDGFQIFCKNWIPSASNEKLPLSYKGVVLISHGLAEHCLWYEQIALHLNKEGYLVCAHDHVGHGQSEGDKVNIKSFSEYSRDLLKHGQQIRESHSDLPLFVLGHSMGALIALKAILEEPTIFTGLILIGPALEVNPAAVSPFMVLVIRAISFLLPNFGVVQLNANLISRDESIVKKYIEDPLVWHGKTKARWACLFYDATLEIGKRLSEIQIPFLVIHGSKDEMTELSGSKRLYKEASSKNKTLSIYEGCYHQVHNEPNGEGERCLQEITEWLLKNS